MVDYFSPYGNAMAYRQYPTRVISGDQILELGPDQSQTLIGHTLAYCSELESALNEALTKAEKYYDLGVKEGYIIPPKSQEDINAELLKTIQALTDKIEKMEAKGNAGLSANSTVNSEIVQPGTGKSSGKGTAKVQQG